MKPQNKQSFYIERISRRNKAATKEVVKSPAKVVKSLSKIKSPAKITKSKKEEPEKLTQRSTRGRPALDK